MDPHPNNQQRRIIMSTKLDRKLAKFQKLNAKADTLRSEIAELAAAATASGYWANMVVAPMVSDAPALPQRTDSVW
jgi:hypothetical protein